MRLTLIFAALVAACSALMAMSVSALAMQAPDAPPAVIEIVVEPQDLEACQLTLAQVLGGPVQDHSQGISLLPVVALPDQMPIARCVLHKG